MTFCSAAPSYRQQHMSCPSVCVSVRSTACAVQTSSALRCAASSVASYVAYRLVCLSVCLSVSVLQVLLARYR